TLHLPLQRALSLYAAQQHSAPDLSGPASAFASLPQAVLVLRPDRQLLYANPAAQSLLSLGDGRAVGGRLECLGQLEAADLDELLARGAAGTTEEQGLWFGPDLHTGRVHAASLAARAARAAAWPEGSLLLTVQRDAPRISQAARIAGLASRCALSPAERQVLELLCAGLSVGQVADRLGVRISTVRTHVRALLEKTGAGRLMLLLAQMGTVSRHAEMV
ncbi:MAG: helix-turn-helix domain-containing protein, partial [Burkholderiaceae bacterium]|nr:helix-turn-helix domain-containing protein [Burkholderiaceae bacterium]